MHEDCTINIMAFLKKCRGGEPPKCDKVVTNISKLN